MTDPRDPELRSILSRQENPDPAILLELVPLLPEALLPRALEVALGVIYPAMDLRAHLADALAHRLAEAKPDIVKEALAVARANLLHTEEGAEAALVTVLAPVLQEELLPVALQLALRIPRLTKRRNALAALARRLPPSDADAVLSYALKQAHDSKEDGIRYTLISPLIPHLNKSLAAKARAIVLEIRDAQIRAGLLTELVPYFITEERRSVIEDTLSAIRLIKEPDCRVQALVDLARYLSDKDLLKRALQIAQSVKDRSIGIRAMIVLARHLSGDELLQWLPKLVRRVDRLPDPYQRASALAQFAHLLPHEERQAALREILKTARSLRSARASYEAGPGPDWRDPEERAEGLIDLARHLPPQDRGETLHEAARAAQSVPDIFRRNQIMESVGSLMPEPPPFSINLQTQSLERENIERESLERRAQLEQQAFAFMRRIKGHGVSIDWEMISQLALSPSAKQAPAVSRMVRALKSITDEHALVDKIETLAPHLEDIHLSRVIALARGIQDQAQRSNALIALAWRFPQVGQPPLIEEALASVEANDDLEKKSCQLSDLAPLLNDAQKREAFGKALKRIPTVRKSEIQAELFWALAEHFPKDMLPEAWSVARSIRAKAPRASALMELAPYLPVKQRSNLLGDALEAVAALGEDGARYMEDLALILPEPLLKQAVSITRKYRTRLIRADALAALLAELSGYATGEQRWPLLREALEQALRSAVLRGGGKAGRSEPETGSATGERARQLLQELPEVEGRELLGQWLGPLSARTRQEMAFSSLNKGGEKFLLKSARVTVRVEGAHFEAAVARGTESTAPPVSETRERVVNTGFALRDHPDRHLGGDTPLTAGDPYYFWLDVGKLDPGSIETQPSPLPAALHGLRALLSVVLFTFPGEIQITPGADIGMLELKPDGSVSVQRQPGRSPAPVQDPKLLDTRLFFPVKAPDGEGACRFRCHIYYEQILVQSRVIEAQVMRRPRPVARALQSKLDYSLAPSLQPGHLARLQPHRLSILLNDNGDTTHTLRFFGANGGEPVKFDAHLLSSELEIPMLNARKALWKASWNDENPWDPETYPKQKYRYERSELNPKQLREDLIGLAVSGYILYNAIIDKLTGGRASSYQLAELMRRPGLVQIALHQSSSQVLPAAMFYDYDLDTQANHKLCETFETALHDHTHLEDTPCFQGACPSLGKPDADQYVCPSGFWGFRHCLGMPLSAAANTNIPPEIVVQGTPQMVVGVATNLDFVEKHLSAIQGIRTNLGWHESEHRDDLLDWMKTIRPHLIYFYCHGGVSKDTPFLQVGNGDEYIEGSNLRSKHIYWDGPQPLVFVNGCHTAALDPKQIISLVQDFFATGGAGVIGTEITIFEPLACEFAEEFLTCFLKLHTSVGAAVCRSRLKLLEKGNPLGLAYTPFILPSIYLLEH